MTGAMVILALTCGLVIGRLSAPGVRFRNRSEPLRRRRHVR